MHPTSATVRTTLATLLLAMFVLPSALADEKAEAKGGDLVVLAAIGPSPHTQTALDSLADFLKEKGVSVKVQPIGAARTEVVEKLPSLGAKSLVYLTVDIAAQFSDSMKIECFDEAGKRIWEEKSTKSFGISPESVAKDLLEEIQEKLGPHLGKPGLPTKAKAP